MNLQKTKDDNWKILSHWMRSLCWDPATLCWIMWDCNIWFWEDIEFFWKEYEGKKITCKKCIKEIKDMKDIIKEYGTIIL